MKLPPTSRKRCTSSFDPSSSSSRPNVMHPRHSSETISPVLPNLLCSMTLLSETLRRKVHSSTGCRDDRVAPRETAWYDRGDRESGGRSVQASNVGGLRAPRGPRVAFAVALACWAVGAVVYAALPEDSTARYLAANAVYLAGAAFALGCLARATAGVRGKERLFWGLLAAGLLVGLVADLGWRGLQESAFGTQEVSYQHTAYLVSYLLLVCAMMLLVNWTTNRITLLTFLDASSIMLSGGVLIWYFFLGRMVAGTDGTWAILAVLSWPLFDAALLFLSLVVLSTAGRPPFTGLLAAGFLAFALADGWYLGVRSGNAYGLAGWPDMFWALGLVFLGLAALRATPTIPSLRS